ncbi:hypothetical protein LA080_004224 [Diaporthe eres]|uniref:NADH-ubiquinone oxidoreductase 21.3 kDa subunit n=1 Tax=Diaporthe vaccinii TaxID=105482 RepID=A0ABR4F1I4_9PEZI|nr:hypothetical protein LA080_004224 [Diaporthe eres]
MASKAVAKIAAGGAMKVSTKQTLQSVGIWERIRRSLAIDPERSNGVPLNPHFRWPTPGGQDPLTYDDPVTTPAGDIADNPYWKRDTRRNYPRMSVVSQADTVALLTVGNAANPKVELIGEEGSKALVAAEAEGQEKGLAKVFEEKGVDASKELLVDGMPPLLSGQSLKKGSWDVHPWEVTEEQAYPEKYPCRTFQ